MWVWFYVFSIVDSDINHLLILVVTGNLTTLVHTMLTPLFSLCACLDLDILFTIVGNLCCLSLFIIIIILGFN
jgi:hypothetical protein